MNIDYFLRDAEKWCKEEGYPIRQLSVKAPNFLVRFPPNARFWTRVFRSKEGILTIALRFTPPKEARERFMALEESDRELATSLGKTLALCRDITGVEIPKGLKGLYVYKDIEMERISREGFLKSLMDVYMAHLAVRFSIQKYGESYDLDNQG